MLPPMVVEPADGVAKSEEMSVTVRYGGCWARHVPGGVKRKLRHSLKNRV